jgi:propionyl-CoA synthetase
MEEILLEHPKVADCAVIGVKDSIKGQVPFGFVVCNKNVKAEEYDKICEDLIQMVREELGPVASFKNACCVGGLPKTRSGKILRGTMKKIADGLDFQIVGTIEDRSVFDSLVPAIQNAVKQKKS